MQLRLKPWERIQTPNVELKTYFEADAFDPASWKESTQFAPMRRSLPDDDYWAAKILGAVQREHLEALFRAAGHPDAGEVDYLVDTLMKRREKILRHTFLQVSPLESKGMMQDHLQLEDIGLRYLSNPGSVEYKVRYFDDGNRDIAPQIHLKAKGGTLDIPISSNLMKQTDGYMRVEVHVWIDGKPVPRPAAFHLRQGSDGQTRLVGVVH